MEKNDPQKNLSQLCKIGCGYFGSSNFDGLCSQCYKAKEKQYENNRTLNNSGFSTYKEKSFDNIKNSVVKDDIEEEAVISLPELATSLTNENTASTISNSEINNVVSSTSVKSNRCQLCRKKIGLTGFGCRCGGTFCSAHRYSDLHSCTFDYKIEAENAIRKANPRIVSNKVSKI